MTTLEHLFTRPRGGIGNRLQAIAAARRLCSLTGARCTIVWPEGNYHELLAPEEQVEVVADEPSESVAPRLTMPLFHQGGQPGRWVVPVEERPVVFVESNFFFGAKEEPLVNRKDVLADWLPEPAGSVRDRVVAFASEHFDRTVGMHIRHGDNYREIVGPPLELFTQEAERLVDEGWTIFLATDSEQAEATLRERFGPRIITAAKTWDLPFRWPRKPGRNQMWDTVEIVTDLVDLQLLAASDHVLGWRHSTFSYVAATYNGSPRCMLFEGPPLDPIGGRYRVWERRLLELVGTRQRARQSETTT